MKSGRKKGYCFKSIPTKEGKRLGLTELLHKPFLESVKWSKKRAEKEAQFFKNNFKVRITPGGEGIPVKRLIRTKIVKC